MSRLFRRALSTTPAAYAPGPSRASTLPMAVKRRQEEQPFAQRPTPLTSPEEFASGAQVFPPKLEDQFQAMRKRGQYKGDEASARKAFLAANAKWRGRVRGGHGKTLIDNPDVARADSKADFFGREGAPRPATQAGGPWRDTILGQKIYLPNVQIRLMRNHTPPGEAYDPNVATFRIPPSMTKNDLRSYLLAVYGLEVTFIRTDNYVAPVKRFMGGQIKREAGSKKNYKRAVVGLKEPFHYPDDVEEMRAGTFGGLEAGEAQAADRENVLNGEYAIDLSDDYRKALSMKMNKGWRWRTKTHANAGNTIREIMRRRQEREEALEHGVEAFADVMNEKPAAKDAAESSQPSPSSA